MANANESLPTLDVNEIAPVVALTPPLQEPPVVSVPAGKVINSEVVPLNVLNVDPKELVELTQFTVPYAVV